MRKWWSGVEEVGMGVRTWVWGCEEVGMGVMGVSAL